MQEMVWNIPFERHPYFMGREPLLEGLWRGPSSPSPSVIYGPGGAGKTQLAVEFAYRHAKEFRVVWWVRARDPLTLASDLSDLSQALHIHTPNKSATQALLDGVRLWLERNSGWLLIFDDAGDPASVRPYLPQGRGGRTLLTSRREGWRDAAGGRALDGLPPEEAVEFLLRRGGQDDRESAAALAARLDRLPLSLELAGAYIRQTETPLAVYLSQLLTGAGGPPHPLDPAYDPAPKDCPPRVAQLTQMSLASVKRESPAALDLLNICAFFTPDRIPLKVIREGTQFLPESFTEGAGNVSVFDRAVTTLIRHSLAAAQTDGTLSVHDVVQAVARARLAGAEQKEFAGIAVSLLNDAFPADSTDVRTWPLCAQLLPHSFAAVGYASGAVQAAPDAIMNLLHKAGLYLQEQARFAEAKEAVEQSIAIGEAIYGQKHPTVVASYSNLGGMLKELGELESARGYLERALTITEEISGREDSTAAMIIRKLGEVATASNDLTTAEAYFMQALSLEEKAYGPSHPRIAVVLHNLGAVHERRGELASARELYERAYMVGNTVYGPEHPFVEDIVYSLSRVQKALGGQIESRVIHERAAYVTRRFLMQAGATVMREGKRSLRIVAAQGRLEPYTPLPVLMVNDSPEDYVAELVRHSDRLSRNRMKRAGIIVYRTPPDAVMQIRMAEVRLRDGFVLIPVPFAVVEQALPDAPSCAGVLAEYVHRYLPGADLFDDRNAIGDALSFYGRAALLRRLESELLKCQGVGLFGLRKSGKTSVLLQLGFALRTHPVVHIDLQPHGGKQRFGAELFNEIVGRLAVLVADSNQQFAPRFEPFAPEQPAAELTAEFTRRVGLLAEALAKVKYEPPLVCFLDEVERVLPRAGGPREMAEEFNAFFGALRALCQEQRKLVLLVADVHPDCNRVNYWPHEGVATNPVFNFFKEIYLPTFSEEETTVMLTSIGRLMGHEFDEETLGAVHRESGGHPLVARQLASLLCARAAGEQGGAVNWAAARRYLKRPFIYSNVLKDYLGQSIWTDLRNRDFTSAMAVLRVLACREEPDGWTAESTLLRRPEYTESQLLDALHWLEQVGLITSEETDDGDRRFRMRLRLMALWLRMEMPPGEVARWQTR